MSLTQLLIFLGIALGFRLALSLRPAAEGGRGWFLLTVSALAVFWLQPAMPIRNLDFWLPLATLGLAVWGWIFTTPREARGGRENYTALGVLAGVVLAVALTRFVSLEGVITPSRPPQLGLVAAGLVVLAGVSAVWLRFSSPQSRWLSAGMAALLLLFLAIKVPVLAEGVSAGLRTLVGQSAARAAASDLRWLGFSYIAFRLIHTLRDRQTGRLPLVNLREYVVYALFFPALTAGPIDRLERFIKDLRRPLESLSVDLIAAGPRLAMGLLKKFVLADSLAMAALGPQNAAQLQSTGWAWVALYAYSLQIFLDFSGYTDLAIGLGRLFGIQLPENFNAPYLKPNLTQFWNNWHMTLTQWFRAYFFNPLTRSLRSAKPPLAIPWVILITQLSTMVLIGLWHGVTWNFVLWGVWHGLGIFVQNRYSDWAKPLAARLEERPRLKALAQGGGVILTFHFVSLGWVWFALPTAADALRVFRVLLGL